MIPEKRNDAEGTGLVPDEQVVVYQHINSFNIRMKQKGPKTCFNNDSVEEVINTWWLIGVET